MSAPILLANLAGDGQHHAAPVRCRARRRRKIQHERAEHTERRDSGLDRARGTAERSSVRLPELNRPGRHRLVGGRPPRRGGWHARRNRPLAEPVYRRSDQRQVLGPRRCPECHRHNKQQRQPADRRTGNRAGARAGVYGTIAHERSKCRSIGRSAPRRSPVRRQGRHTDLSAAPPRGKDPDQGLVRPPNIGYARPHLPCPGPTRLPSPSSQNTLTRNMWSHDRGQSDTLPAHPVPPIPEVLPPSLNSLHRLPCSHAPR